MRIAHRISHLVAALAAGGLVASPLVPVQADTITATATADAAAPQATELPARVARLAKVAGTVSFHTADEDHWDPATLNYPVTAGDAFWTEPEASAAIEVAASRIEMASSTEFDVDQLDARTLGATQAQGEVFLTLRDFGQGDSYTIRTPRGTVTINTPGQYAISAGDTQSPTLVSVVEGAAQVSGDNLSLAVQAGQTASVTGSGASGDPFQGSVGPLVRDAFLDSMLAPAATADASPGAAAHASASATVSAEAAPPIVRQMPGGQELSSYGTWDDSPRYGRVWRPRVDASWVPYRDGHWAWVDPWGWTWIDDESWGYAPFHYGRWIDEDSGWAWAPTYYEPGFVTPVYATPVYAPALVGFFGFGAGLATGLALGGAFGYGGGFGFGFGSVGWCPLGFGEPFRPWFGGGGNYFANVNRYSVRNVTNVYNNNSVNNTTINNFANAATGATVVPTAAMVNSQRAASVAQPFGRRNFAEAHPVATVPTPTGRTAGITPRQAQTLKLSDAAAAANRPSAPGPARAPGNTSAAGQRGGPALRPAAGGQQAVSPQARSPQPGLNQPRPTQPRPTQAGPTQAGPAQASRAQPGGAAPGPRLGDPQQHGPTLPQLRAAGVTPRAAGGAPGPAIAPRLGGAPHPQAAGLAPPSLAGRPAGAPGSRPVAGLAEHGAPGPALASHAGTAPGLAAGLAPSAARPSLPVLRAPAAAGSRLASDPANAPGGLGRPPLATQPQVGRAPLALRAPAAPEPPRAAPGLPRSEPPRVAAIQPPGQAPALPHTQPQAQAPQFRAPQIQAPQANAPQTQPQYRAPLQPPRAQTPQFQAPQAQPQFRAPVQQPRVQTPQIQAPRAQPQFQAPRMLPQAQPQFQPQYRPQFQPQYRPQFQPQAPRFQPPVQAFRPAPQQRSGGGRPPWPP